MRWIEWNERSMARLQDARWITKVGAELLGMIGDGRVVIGEESYLYSGNPERFDRIISMCAWLEYPDHSVAGSKWISSKASNVREGLPRGGAVTVLNDGVTGLPLVAYEGSAISLARTAMVSCLALGHLFPASGPGSMAFIGAGRVHQWQANYARQLWPDMKMSVYDLDEQRMVKFQEQFGAQGLKRWEDGLETEVFSLATAGSTAVGWIPWKMDLGQTKVWLHTSLRDIQPRLTEKFPLVVVDDHVLATSQGTTHSFAWRENWVRKEISLVDLVVGHYELSASDYPVLVTPMGLALWDVGIGFRLFEKEFFDELFGVLSSALVAD